MAASPVAGAVWRHGRTLCDVLDLTDPASSWAGSQAEEGGNRWLVICPHGCLASVPEHDDARWLAAHPSEFCEEHR